MNSTLEPLRLQAVPDIGEFGRPRELGRLLPGKGLRTSENVRAWTAGNARPRLPGRQPPACRRPQPRHPARGGGAAAPGRHGLSLDFAGGRRRRVVVRGGGPALSAADFVRRRLAPALLQGAGAVAEHRPDRAASGGDRVVLAAEGLEAVLRDPVGLPGSAEAAGAGCRLRRRDPPAEVAAGAR